MPKHKDLKRIVRTRMRKTGESYTAARLRILARKPAPTPDLASLAGMSDAAVSKQTGRTWHEWAKLLDDAGATSRSHRENVHHVASLGISSWWSQMVTVGYERIRGLRETGQKQSGAYEASRSRTFGVPLERLYRAAAGPRTRARWLPGAGVRVRAANPNKTLRLGWPDETRVEISFAAKGAARSQIAITHQRLPDRPAAVRMKAFWGERLDALSQLLER